METSATESSYSNNCPEQITEDRENTASEKTRYILHNIIVSIDNLWCLKDGLYAAVQKELQNDARLMQAPGRTGIGSEFESAVAELQESNCKLAAIKAEKDATNGAFFPILKLGSKTISGDKVKDKHRDLHEMESSLKELTEQASSRLTGLKSLHEERIQILQQLSNLQNKLKSESVFLLPKHSFWREINLKSQSQKSSVIKIYLRNYRLLLVEKDNLAWREKELNVKNDIAGVFQRSLAVSNSQAYYLGAEIKRQIDERKRIEAKLEEASREPGRKEIIADFKNLLSSFPEAMSSIQSQLGKYKEAVADIHSLRADVQSLSSILDRKVQDLKDSDMEMKLMLDMYIREFTDSRDILEVKDSEYKAWAHVQSLKSRLDEHNLELRVKTANEAEAMSQQRLAAAEAEIAELRHKLEASNSLAFPQSIGQAYDDMQTQNQQRLQQITERDDYNIKLVLEGLRAKQLQDTLLLEKHTMEEIQQASASLDFYNKKAGRIEDQMRFCSDQVHKFGEDFKSQFCWKLRKSDCRILEDHLIKQGSHWRNLNRRLRKGELMSVFLHVIRLLGLTRKESRKNWKWLLLQNATISSATLVYRKSPKAVTTSVRCVLQASVPMMLNLFISDIRALITTASPWDLACIFHGLAPPRDMNTHRFHVLLY
ncbi:epoxide hydrolase 2 [Hibiscus syriacus]|uniref:E3 ubiquitin protein ligase n=1 Tax=Hibiscus syriacus TaxID=106335 RepID=A0A6A3AD92_HIBSY|nr:epoxide hydrolase 2 [Hibiscus syriacus]